MLHKIAEGPIRRMNYGLALANVVPFPGQVLSRAEEVVEVLNQRHQRLNCESEMSAYERKRKLVLNLKEHLVQAREGAWRDESLRAWLRELQREFVSRMRAIDRPLQQ